MLNDNVLDQGLNYITTNGDRIDICSLDPATYASATSTHSLGNAATTTGAPQNGDVSGRKVTIAAISGGSVTGTGTATHWALTDGTGVLIATGSLAASQAVTNGNTFDLAAFDIEIPDPA